MASALKKAFVADHRRMTRGFVDLRSALADNDLSRARQLADALDEIAGPHIEFEERCFYPALKSVLGGAFVARLYHEHGSGREVLARLLAPAGDGGLDAAGLEALDAAIEDALQHAYSCGTLVSHIDRFDPEKQEQLLETLNRMRASGVRWTHLPRSARSSAA